MIPAASIPPEQLVLNINGRIFRLGKLRMKSRRVYKFAEELNTKGRNVRYLGQTERDNLFEFVRKWTAL